MQYDFLNLDATSRYKLLTGIVVPRPIAWVTSLNQDQSVNAAPFSFFNVVGSDPGLVVINIGDHSDRPKDSAVNIERQREFVVNMVSLPQSQAMSDSATDYPPGVSEPSELGIELTPSSTIQTPRIANSPAALECTWERTLTIGENRLLFGVVQSIYIVDQALIDAQRCLIDSQKLDLIGRMGGAGGYTNTHGYFHVDRKRFRG